MTYEQTTLIANPPCEVSTVFSVHIFTGFAATVSITLSKLTRGMVVRRNAMRLALMAFTE